MVKIERVFPEVFDNSMLSDFKSCPVKAMWRHEYGFRKIVEDQTDLVAGGAFARGVEVAKGAFHLSGAGKESAIKEGLMALDDAYGEFKPYKYSLKTKDRMLGALVRYFEKWPLDAGVELVGVEVPLVAAMNGVKYGGKLDALYRGKDGTLMPVDDKTTGRIDEKWLGQWDLDSQMTGYKWLVEAVYGEKVSRVQVRGVGVGRDGVECVEVDVTREAWEMERWVRNTVSTVNAWRASWVSWEADRYRMALDWQCGRCPYAMLCKAWEPELLMEGGYVVERWEPFKGVGK